MIILFDHMNRNHRTTASEPLKFECELAPAMYYQEKSTYIGEEDMVVLLVHLFKQSRYAGLQSQEMTVM